MLRRDFWRAALRPRSDGPQSGAIYVKAVRRRAAYYRRSPDESSEEEVRG